MNSLFKKTAILLLFAVIVVGCDATNDTTSDNLTASETVAKKVESPELEETVDAEDNLAEDDASAVEDVAEVLMPEGFEETPSPNKEMISELAELGVFDEVSKDFNLLEPITRGEYLALLYYANNAVRDSERHIRLSPSYKLEFTDIDSSHPAYKYVQAFSNTGYSVGYQDNTFKPDQPLTREEMIALKVPVDTTDYKEEREIDDFDDADQISPEFIRYIFHDGVIEGEKGSNIDKAFGSVKVLKPQEPVLGYEAAATLWDFTRLEGSTSNKNETATKALAAREKE